MSQEYSTKELRDKYNIERKTALERVQEHWNGYLFIAPIVLLFLGLFYLPFLRGIWISFLEFNLGSPNTFVGVDNYFWVLTNDLFVYSFTWTVVFVIGTTFLQLTLGLSAALVVNEFRTGVKAIMSSLLIAPYLISALGSAVMIKWFLNTNYGGIAHIFDLIGIQPISFLSQGFWPFITLIIGVAWHDYAWATIIYVAALHSIPGEQYEAAVMDGAGFVERFRSVTVPHLLTPTIIVLSLRTAYNVAEFAIPFELTGGGPGTRTMVLSHLTYRLAYVDFTFGRSFVVGIVMTVLSISAAVFYIMVIREERDLYI